MTSLLIGDRNVEIIGQTWCKPATYWMAGETRFGGAVAISTSAGPLLLCNIERHSDAFGNVEIHHNPVKDRDLKTAIPMTW